MTDYSFVVRFTVKQHPSTNLFYVADHATGKLLRPTGNVERSPVVAEALRLNSVWLVSEAKAIHARYVVHQDTNDLPAEGFRKWSQVGR